LDESLVAPDGGAGALSDGGGVGAKRGNESLASFTTAGVCCRQDSGTAAAAPPGKYDNSIRAPRGVPGRNALTRTLWLE